MRGKQNPSTIPRTLALILAINAGLLLLFAFRILPWKQPDESAHFLYVKHLVDQRTFPVLRSKQESNLYEAHQPPLYYLSCLPVYLVARSGDDVRSLYALRVWTCVFGVATLWFVWLLASALYPRRPVLSLSATAFVGLLPMHLYVASSVGNDALAGMLCAATLAVAVRSLKSAPTWRTSALLGHLVGLGMLTKTTCLFLAPVVALRFVWQQAGQRSMLRQWLTHTAFAGAVAAGVSGWWLARNVVLYGDPFAIGKFNEVFIDSPHPSYFLVQQGMSLPGYVCFVAQWVFFTFWGLLGEVNDAIGRLASMYGGQLSWDGTLCLALCAVFAAATALAALGARSLWPHGPGATAAKHGLGLVFVAAVLVVAGFVQFNMTYFQAQARYLHPAVGAFALLYAGGTERLPSRGAQWAARVVLALAMALTCFMDVTVWR